VIDLAGPITADERWAIWERDDFRCHYCGVRRHLGVDHVIPRSQGGTNELANLVTSCRSCNSRKSAKPYQDFRRELETGVRVVVHRNPSLYDRQSVSFPKSLLEQARQAALDDGHGNISRYIQDLVIADLTRREEAKAEKEQVA
jgi:hypothetical protein